MAIGGICLLLGFIFTLKHCIKPRYVVIGLCYIMCTLLTLLILVPWVIQLISHGINPVVVFLNDKNLWSRAFIKINFKKNISTCTFDSSLLWYTSLNTFCIYVFGYVWKRSRSGYMHGFIMLSRGYKGGDNYTLMSF